MSSQARSAYPSYARHKPRASWHQQRHWMRFVGRFPAHSHLLTCRTHNRATILRISARIIVPNRRISAVLCTGQYYTQFYGPGGWGKGEQSVWWSAINKGTVRERLSTAEWIFEAAQRDLFIYFIYLLLLKSSCRFNALIRAFCKNKSSNKIISVKFHRNYLGPAIQRCHRIWKCGQI